MPKSRPDDHCNALRSEKVDSRVSNAVLEGVVLKLREKHAAHIRRLVRNGDDEGSGYGEKEMWRRADIAGFVRLEGSMVGMNFLRGAGVDVSWEEWLLEWKSV